MAKVKVNLVDGESHIARQYVDNKAELAQFLQESVLPNNILMFKNIEDILVIVPMTRLVSMEVVTTKGGTFSTVTKCSKEGKFYVESPNVEVDDEPE